MSAWVATPPRIVDPFGPAIREDTLSEGLAEVELAGDTKIDDAATLADYSRLRANDGVIGPLNGR